MAADISTIVGAPAAQPRINALQANRPARAVTAYAEYIAEQLCAVRSEAAHLGRLRDGSYGTWEQVLLSLESEVGNMEPSQWVAGA